MRLNRAFKVSLFFLTFLAATASHAGFKSKAFVSGESIKTIGLLKVGEPRGYFLGEGGGPGAAGQVFGLGGILFEQFKKPKHPEYVSAGFHFSAEAERVLTAHLKAAGFNVIVVPVKRKKSYQLLDDYDALSVPNVDAYLDIASGGLGYRKSTFSAFPGAAHKVGPVVNVVVQLVSARTKKVLYAETLEYGWGKATVGSAGIDIDAPDDHIFNNTDALEADLRSGAGSRGLTQLTQGIDVAMRRIVSEFSTYPATGPALQAGATPDSPIDIARAAPASVSALRSGWRQKAVTDFQPLIGKWEGFGLTPKGEKFDYEVTYRDDGTYTFRSNRGTLHSGRRNTHIADGVYVGKSYKTGDPITIAVYEDAHGNHVMKMHRTDGLTWTVAKTKSALSSFLAADGDKVKVAAMAPAATTAKPATAPAQHAEVKTNQTASFAAPFEGITLAPGGSVQAINAAAEAYCGSLNKQSRLIAAPPANPNYVFQCYQLAKAAPTPPTTTPPDTPLPGVALTGWRQKAVTDFQPLIGKWEGFSSSGTRGKKYDFETTYRDDGTYTFRSNRGTLHSGRRNTHIADGVYVGKSYKTGESYTIAVYEDAHGNHVMKMHRTDGVTWTVAKTEYALSSFLGAGGDKVKVAPMAPPSGTTPKSVPGVTSPTTTAKAAAKVFRQRTGVGPQWAVKRCYELLGLETEDKFIESCVERLKAYRSLR